MEKLYLEFFMEITAQIIEGIKYKSILKYNLVETEFISFDINSAKSSSLVLENQNRFAVSKWVSPKRTRSYPYERVYNTFSVSKRITVIPIVKDEGSAGDRDFLQWDTVSLMSLLDVYVIIAYYETAEKHRSRLNKITNQKFNNQFVINKIREISNYHSSALHWNLKELKSISQVLDKVNASYQNIANKTGVEFHSQQGLDAFQKVVSENLEDFMKSSRTKAESAQGREFLTIRPKEILSTQTKAKLTITNYLGGKYFFTVDEIEIPNDSEIKVLNNFIFLIESKHSKSAKIPSNGDIKDGLLKMMLYTNLENVTVGEISYISTPILKLTSEKLFGNISSHSSETELDDFLRVNKLNKRQISFVKDLFSEAKENNFIISIGKI
jgi:hypothetical protein